MNESKDTHEINSLLSVLQSSYTSSFNLEIAIYHKLKGSHNKENRKKLNEKLTGKKHDPGVVNLADLLKREFDQLHLF